VLCCCIFGLFASIFGPDQFRVAAWLYGLSFATILCVMAFYGIRWFQFKNNCVMQPSASESMLSAVGAMAGFLIFVIAVVAGFWIRNPH
jgi:hypothetical protein